VTTQFDKCLYSTNGAGSVKIGGLAKHHLSYNQKENQLTISRLGVRVKTPPACNGRKFDTRVNFYEVSNCRGNCVPKIVCSNTRLTEKGGFKWTNKNFGAWQTKKSFGYEHLGAVLDFNTIKDGACDCHAKINVNFCVRFEVRLYNFVLWVDEAKFKVQVHIETGGEERGETYIQFTPAHFPIAIPTYKATVIATTTVISKPLIFFCEETSTGWQRKASCNRKVEQSRAFALCIVGDTVGSTITAIHSLSLGVDESCPLCLNTKHGGDRCAWDTRLPASRGLFAKEYERFGNYSRSGYDCRLVRGNSNREMSGGELNVGFTPLFTSCFDVDLNLKLCLVDPQNKIIKPNFKSHTKIDVDLCMTVTCTVFNCVEIEYCTQMFIAKRFFGLPGAKIFVCPFETPFFCQPCVRAYNFWDAVAPAV
jgi:hypothetical protein